MTTGTIKKLISERGFGFIAGTDGKEYFFHRNELGTSSDFDRLIGGERVEFEIGASPLVLEVQAEIGALLAAHPSAAVMSKKLMSFKDLLLVGFFLSIGMTGEITVNDQNELDHETTPTFALTVAAIDAEGAYDTAIVTINLNDVNDAPTDITLDNATVAENAAYTGAAPTLGGDTPIGALTYTLSGTDAGDFTVDSSTGVVSMVAWTN